MFYHRKYNYGILLAWTIQHVRSSVKQYDVNNGHKLISHTIHYHKNLNLSHIYLNQLKSKVSQDSSTFLQEIWVPKLRVTDEVISNIM